MKVKYVAKRKNEMDYSVVQLLNLQQFVQHFCSKVYQDMLQYARIR